MYLKLIAVALVGLVILGLWVDIQAKKTTIVSLESQLNVCSKDVEQFKGEVDSLNGIIEKLRDNLDSIKKQMARWKQIAKDADDFTKRIIAAAESRTSCEVYNAENTKIAVDITNAFNSSVRGKVRGSGASTDSGAASTVLSTAGSARAGQPSTSGGKDSNSDPTR